MLRLVPFSVVSATGTKRWKRWRGKKGVEEEREREGEKEGEIERERQRDRLTVRQIDRE